MSWSELLSHSLQQHVPLASMTWLRVGGPAEYLLTPHTIEELQFFLKNRPKTLPFTVLGAGSNILVRDGGIPGVSIHINRTLDLFAPQENNLLYAGSGLLCKALAKKAHALGLAGLEFLYTIPGTVGGALRMNAGAHGKDIQDVITHATLLDPRGKGYKLPTSVMNYQYRHCALPEDWVFTGGFFKVHKDTPQAIQTRMEILASKRRETQPAARTGGSTFKNPPGPTRAWEYIAQAGCKNMRVGGAALSEKHCNFLLNQGDATAHDLETLGTQIQERVQDKMGVSLEWEIRRIGLK